MTTDDKHPAVPDVPMPLRPRQHELEDASRRAFESALPDRLVYRTLDYDYGIDGEVEDFIEGRATGLKFFVQLKATDQKEPAKALKVPVQLSTATYLRSQTAPVLMVRYLAHTKRLYLRWFHLFDPYYEHVGDEQLTFHWSEDDLLTAESVNRLSDEARAVLKAKSANLELPVRTAIEVPLDGAFGMTRAELELGVRAVITHCPDLLRIVDSTKEHLLLLRVRDAEISASVGGLGALTLHLDESYEAGDDGTRLGTELLAAAAVAFARAGHPNLAARIGVHFFAESLLAFVSPATWELAEAMASSARIAEALEVANRLEQSEEKELAAAAFVFTLAALRRSSLLREDERLQLVDALDTQIERREEAGDTLAAAGLAVGLGNHHLSARNFPAAVGAYRRALELDREYESREHFWLELGGAHFLAGEYLESAAAYQRALSVTETPATRTQALRADALLYAGCYEEALGLFELLPIDDSSQGPWIHSKVTALRWVIAATGQSNQSRDPDAAAQVAGVFLEREVSREELEDIASEIWALDALSPLGWFNLARAYLDAGEVEQGMYSYLVTAVMQEGDVEAWANVVSLAMTQDNAALFSAAVITGARLNGERFMLQLAKLAQASMEDPADREEFLASVNEMLEQAIPAAPSTGFEVRFVERGKPTESIHLPVLGSRG